MIRVRHVFVAPCVFCYYYSYIMAYDIYLIMRIRFRGSDFGLVAKINIIRAKSKQASCGEIVLGSFVFLLVWLGFWTQKIQANVDYCYVRRRAECTSLRPELKHLSLRSDSSLAAKRRADALHVVFFFNKAPEHSTGAAAALCILSHDT